VQAATAVEPGFVAGPAAEASVEFSDPAAMPLDAAPESALDVASLEYHDSTSSAWDGEGIAFGSVAVEPAPADAELDQCAQVVESLEATTVESHSRELSMYPSFDPSNDLSNDLSNDPANVAMSVDGAEAFGIVIPAGDPSLETVEPHAEFTASETASDVETMEPAHDLDSFVAAEVSLEGPASLPPSSESVRGGSSDMTDVESIAVAAPAAVDSLGDTSLVEAQVAVDGIERVAGSDASIAVSDAMTTSWLESAPPASLDWSGELESVRVEGDDSSVEVVAPDVVELIHTSNADAESETAGADAPEVIAAEAEAPLLDVELKGFHLKPEEVLEVPAPIPGFEGMIAEPPTQDVEGVAGDVAAVAEASPVVSAADETEAAGDQEGAHAEEVVSWRVASAPPETLAQGDADLQEFLFRSRSQAHVLETLEAVARRVRGGEIVPTTDAGASPEAVLASVLASLLSARP
jgi:hypothetical protein